MLKKKLIYCQVSTFGTLMYAGSNKDDTKGLENINFNLRVKFFYSDRSGNIKKFGFYKAGDEQNEENKVEFNVNLNKEKYMTLLTNINYHKNDKNITLQDSATAINTAISTDSIGLAKGFLKVINIENNIIQSIEEDNTRKLDMAKFTFYNSTNLEDLANHDFNEVLDLNKKGTKIGLRITLMYTYKDNFTPEHDKDHTHDEDHEHEEEPKGKQDDDQSKTHRGCCVCGKR